VGEGWFSRMMPPLVHQDEAEELLQLLADGLIDVVETDHAPHAVSDKWAAEQENPMAIHDPNHRTCFGVPGIDLVMPLLLYQVKRGRLSLKRLVDATSIKPAKIIGVKLLPTTQVTWDTTEYRIGDSPGLKLSGSGWTPYSGKLAVGIVKKIKVGNKLLIKDGKIVNKLSRVVAQRGELI
jgi:dihydroorotase